MQTSYYRPRGSENRPAGWFGSSRVNRLRTSGTWADGPPGGVKESQRAAVGRELCSGVRGCQHLSSSLRNPTSTHGPGGAWVPSSSVGRGEGSGFPLGVPDPTHLHLEPAHPPKEGEAFTHTQTTGNAFQTGNNSEARSQRSTGKGFSLEIFSPLDGTLGAFSKIQPSEVP